MKNTQKWQWWFKPFSKVYYRLDGPGWHLFYAGIIKIHTIPQGGQALGKEDYKGVIIRFMWWFPIDRA